MNHIYGYKAGKTLFLTHNKPFAIEYKCFLDKKVPSDGASDAARLLWMERGRATSDVG